jgi:ubiquinone/menaquinone biosynthesis C-methylase UbiE
VFRGNIIHQKEFLQALNEMEAEQEYHWDMQALYWEYKRIQCIKSVLTTLKLSHATVIDVGCGDGVMLSWLEQKGAVPVGADVSLTRLNRSLNYCSASHVQADIVQLPFPDNTFDIVVCTDVLEHLSTMDEAVSELCRVCSDKGYLLISVPCCNVYRILTRKRRYISPYTHVREFSYFDVDHFEPVAALRHMVFSQGYILKKRRGTCVFSIDFYKRHPSSLIGIIDGILSLIQVKGLHLYEVLLFGRN